MHPIFSKLASTHLGFDPLFAELDFLLNPGTAFGGQRDHFPPINIFKDGDNYTIEVAVAGFKEEDITIEFDEHQRELTIKGQQNTAEKQERESITQGIAGRSFKRLFKLAEGLDVKRAELKYGLLTIEIEARPQSTYAPRVIQLSEPAPKEAVPLIEEQKQPD
jgi:molecular chaperone IbpA